MIQVNEGRRHVVDNVDALRTAFLVETSDVGTGVPQYLGQSGYTFQSDDVGRLVEVITDKSPGFMSWKFGSIFKDLREAYPDPKPYVVLG